MPRANCPHCDSNDTWAHYEHKNCSNVNLVNPVPIPDVAVALCWEAPAELQPNGQPIAMPCPGNCDNPVPQPPAYFYCQQCHHRWII